MWSNAVFNLPQTFIMSAVASPHVNRITIMTQVSVTFVFSCLWLQVQCQGVTQVPEISWSYASKSAEMNCSHNKDISHNQMYWYRQRPGETMTLIVYTIVGGKPDYGENSQTKYSAIKEDTETGSLTVKDLQPEDSGVYFCAVSRGGNANEAYFGKGTKLTVLEDGHNITSPKVEVLKPSKYECRNKKDENRKKTIVCVASGFYPDHVSVSWQLNGEKVTKGVATDNTALRDGETYKITSRLRVSAEDWFKPDNKFKCIVSFYNGTSEVNYEKPVNGEKAENTGSTMTKEQYLKVTHAGKLSYVVFIIKSCIYGVFVGFLVWKLQGSAGKVNI